MVGVNAGGATGGSTAAAVASAAGGAAGGASGVGGAVAGAAGATSDMAGAATLLRYLLRRGDTSLVLGQRLGEWGGHAPALEEDLGLANLALDLIGQARLLLSYG